MTSFLPGAGLPGAGHRQGGRGWEGVAVTRSGLEPLAASPHGPDHFPGRVYLRYR